MAWVRTRLSARGCLDAYPQDSGFTCRKARLCSALESFSREYDMYPTHRHWQYRILRPGAKDRCSYKRHKTHAYIQQTTHTNAHACTLRELCPLTEQKSTSSQWSIVWREKALRIGSLFLGTERSALQFPGNSWYFLLWMQWYYVLQRTSVSEISYLT